LAVESDPAAVAQTWRTTHGDMSDGEWALIADLVAPYWTPGGITVADRARGRSGRFAKLWCDSGFKRTFIDHCRSHHVGVEVVKRIHPGPLEALPKRWIVERTWAWLMNSRRLQVDYERAPVVTEDFISAAHEPSAVGVATVKQTGHYALWPDRSAPRGWKLSAMAYSPSLPRC
jgi:transposase